VYWFGARSLGHVAEKELNAWDADAFEASLAEVKRGRDKLELALEEARAHENGGGAVSVDVGSTPEAVVETAAKEGSEAETPAPAPAAKKKRGGGGRKKVIEEEEEAAPAEVAGEEETQAANDDVEDYKPNAEEEEAKPSGKKRKLSKKADGEDKKDKQPAEKKPAKSKKVEIEKPVIKVPSSTPRLLELKTELEDGLQAYEDTQEQQERARLELEKAKEAVAAAQMKVEQANSHANRVVRRLKQTARHIQEQSVNPVMLQETLITKTVKKGSKVKDLSLADFAKTCGTVMVEWIELVRTSAVNMVAVQPVEEVKKVVKEENSAEDVKMEDAEDKPATDSPAKLNLPPVLAETFAKKGSVAKPAAPAAGGVPKEPAHDATRLRVARYLEQEHGLSRNASLTLEAALFDQAGEPGMAYKAALKRIVNQPSIMSSNAPALDSGTVKPALLLAFRG